MHRSIAPIVAGLTLVAVLSGCTVSASANRTVSPSGFEDVVADALEREVGQRPLVDCGTDPIDLVEGDTVHCEIGAEGDTTVYDSVVEVRDVDGTDYAVHVQVDEQPKS
ncbi:MULTISPECIES: hypothetical protein [unclassified Curtobacterium]|uniref:hypothetical protein n=1 Tax=unclassified Curtobacterium TaxID=257496 RepID=UPI000835F115|nr:MULTISPECIES: hypothetical protein [unclassified Curtobacterium]MBP1302021.1 hypothetical protein [Curtobacterium sp. 1310]MDT0209900.1 hypothetical protein [Curtobacterium sp. BRD11]